MSNNICYDGVGAVREGDYPCDPNAEVSICCGSGSVCLDNLYCVTSDGSRASGTCTYRQWGTTGNPSCPCSPCKLERWLHQSPPANISEVTNTTLCSDGSYCCGLSLAQCCDQEKGWPIIHYENTATIPALSSGDPGWSSYYAGLHVSTNALFFVTTSTSVSTT
jgi:hypothetical protein